MNSAVSDLGYASVVGTEAAEALARADAFLREPSTPELLELVGQTVPSLALRSEAADKRFFPRSYGGGKPCADDLLAGRGMVYVTQAGKVMLDCTSGHYQMTWGYNHPELNAAVADALGRGVVYDNHSNIPPMPVKRLVQELVRLADGAAFDRMLLGTATGSVACGAALKIALARYWRDSARTALGPPVVIALAGNYHGTDMVAQTLRGLWPGLVAGMEPVQVEPNDPDALAAAFGRYGRRVAAFWAEPIMMNREVIEVRAEYLALARELCTRNDALMILDEIQTGFWYPEVFFFRRLALAPDIVVVGKGLTAGFHPLAGILYRRELDILEQYDAISTNGNAALAALVGLCSLRLLEREGRRVAAVAARHFEGLRAIAADFPDLIESVNGSGLLTGLRFRDRADALGFHTAAVERGLWCRVHAYHPGHRTVLTKHPLVVDEPIVDFVLGVMRELLKGTSWRRAGATGASVSAQGYH